MQERYSPRNIAGQRREQYGPTFQAEDLRQRADDIRRDYIIKYSRAPGHEIGLDGVESDPRNMWRELAVDTLKFGGNTPETIGMDVGTSSGYLIDMLLEEGYAGNLLAVDIHTRHFPHLRDWLNREFEHAADRVNLGLSNAEILRSVRNMDGTISPLPADFSDFTVIANVLHHTAQPKHVLNAVHRVTREGGTAIFAGRNPEHLANLYTLGNIVAKEFNVTPPESFYHTYDLKTLYEDLGNMKGYKIVATNFQGVELKSDRWKLNEDGLYIPEDGWPDLLRAFYTLLPMMKKPNGKSLKKESVAKFMENEIKPNYFLPMVEQSNGYAYEPLAQGYLICRVVK